MKRFRIKEVYKVTGFSYIRAETKEEAIQKLERAPFAGHDFDEMTADWECEDTDWDSIEEV